MERKSYIVIANVNGTILRSRWRSYDSAMARASSYRAQGFQVRIKVLINGQIMN
jgi:hypothetical protein